MPHHIGPVTRTGHPDLPRGSTSGVWHSTGCCPAFRTCGYVKSFRKGRLRPQRSDYQLGRSSPLGVRPQGTLANEFADVVKWAEAELTAPFRPDDVWRFLRDRFGDASFFLP